MTACAVRTHMILPANSQPGDEPKLLEPIVGKWYCGMLAAAFDDQPASGELMRYEGEGCWLAEDEDPDSREPDPADYDYLVEQL